MTAAPPLLVDRQQPRHRSSCLPLSSSSRVCLRAMWDALLSNPSTRAYLMRFPPSTWEEKAVEAVQCAVEGSSGHSRSHSRTTKHTADGGSNRRSAAQLGRQAQSEKSDRAEGGRSRRSVVSSPALPAQPFSLLTPTAPPAPPQRHPLVRPLPSASPLLPLHARPVTYAEEWHYSSPYLTSAAAIGAQVSQRDWPHRVGRNERNYSSATLLHHHSYSPPAASPATRDTATSTDTARSSTAPSRSRHGHGTAQPHAVWADEREGSAAAPGAAYDAVVAKVAEDDAAKEEVRVREEPAGRWRYGQREGNLVTVNVQCQHPPHAPHSAPAATLSTHAAQPAVQHKTAAVTVQQPLSRGGGSVKAASAPPQLHSSLASAPTAASSSSASFPPAPFYSSAQPSRPLLHASYWHPHSVYPAWWPSEADRLAAEAAEEARRLKEEARQRRLAAAQRADNARVRPVMEHTCPPPPPQAREGVAERKEDRQREWDSGLQARGWEERRLHIAGGSDVDVLAPATQLLSASADSTRVPTSERVGRERSLRASLRPADVAQSRIKALLDRDRRQGALLHSPWTVAPLAQSPLQPDTSSPDPSTDAPIAAPTAALSFSGTNYAALIRSLASDPIVASFGAQQPADSLPPSPRATASSRTAALLAAAASVSSAAAAAALDGVANASRDTAEDRRAGRREWEHIAAAQAAAPFSRQLERQRMADRDVQVEDASDDSDETHTLRSTNASSVVG